MKNLLFAIAMTVFLSATTAHAKDILVFEKNLNLWDEIVEADYAFTVKDGEPRAWIEISVGEEETRDYEDVQHLEVFKKKIEGLYYDPEFGEIRYEHPDKGWYTTCATISEKGKLLFLPGYKGFDEVDCKLVTKIERVDDGFDGTVRKATVKLELHTY